MQVITLKVADNGDVAVVTSSNRASTVVTTNPNKTWSGTVKERWR